MNTVLLPVTQQIGAALVVVDHKTKAAIDSRFSRGASAKLGLVDLALNVRASQPFSKDRSGTVDLKVTKDRWGDFGREAEWSVTVGTGDGRMVWSSSGCPNRTGESGPPNRTPASRTGRWRSSWPRWPRPVRTVSAGHAWRRLCGARRTARASGSNTVRTLVEQALAAGRLAEGGRKQSGVWSLVVPPKAEDDQLDGGAW